MTQTNVGIATSSNLEAMLEARSVAVVGASPRPGSFGLRMMTELRAGGFTGDIYPVNPNHKEVDGLECIPSLADLDHGVDLALLGVPNFRLEEQLTSAAEKGCRSTVIFASGHEEATGEVTLVDRLRAIAVESGMALCGCNCMGFVNVENGLRACGFYQPEGLLPGGIAFVCHSGSVFSAMLHNRRDLRFNLVVSAGNEMVTGVPDYMSYAVSRPSTRAIGLFIETVRDPRRFEAALATAQESGVVVVALKVGRTAKSEALVAAHTGALAGSDGVFEALFDAYGVIRVKTPDEMTDTLELLTSDRQVGPGGLASLHDSGGERALMVDLAADAGVEFAVISNETKRRLSEVLEPGLDPDNPLDAWGTGNASDEIFRRSIEALADDHETAALAFAVDLTAEDDPSMAYVGMAIEAYQMTTKPMAVLGNLTSAIDPASARRLRDAGIPVLEGVDSGLDAIRHLFELRDYRSRAPVGGLTPLDDGELSKWKGLLRSGRVDEALGLSLLDAYGIPVADARRAGDQETAIEAAHAVGFPVVMKTAEDHPHKDRVGGVVLGLSSEDEVVRAYDRLNASLGPRVMVEAMAEPGMELSMGITRDADFGPIVMVGAGGVMVEVLDERRFAMPPLDDARARALIDGLVFVKKQDATVIRGLDRAAAALARLSQLALDLCEEIQALDVNPLIVTESECVAVDTLIVPRRT